MNAHHPPNAHHPALSRPLALARAALLPCVFAAILCASLASLPAAPKPGDTLPPWSEGFLDIHFINTGVGESAFYILPDGTTMLVDAGVSSGKPPWRHPAVPSDERTAGEWIARYIDRALQSAPKKIINYVLLSHYHEDHMGTINERTKQSTLGNYKASGLTEIADHIPYEKFIDRSWPVYEGDGGPWNDAKMKNYAKFIAWQQKHKGMLMERFIVGVNDQIVLRNNPSKYPEFEIRNIAAGGIVWTGKGTETHNAFKSVKSGARSENRCSIAFRLSYGPFKFFSGGDINDKDSEASPPTDTETPVAQATGPVSALKANHHGNYDANGFNFLRTLRPRVIVIPTWAASHASMSTWRRMKATYPGPRDVFATCIVEATALAIHEVKAQASGHIVIRVSPGGREYFVHRLTDADESGRIKTISGPYSAE